MMIEIEVTWRMEESRSSLWECKIGAWNCAIWVRFAWLVLVPRFWLSSNIWLGNCFFCAIQKLAQSYGHVQNLVHQNLFWWPHCSNLGGTTVLTSDIWPPGLLLFQKSRTHFHSRFDKGNWKYIYSSSSKHFCDTYLRKGLISFLY